MKYTMIFIAALAIKTSASAQIGPQASPATPKSATCLIASEVQAPQLYGEWTVEFLPEISSTQGASSTPPKPSALRARMVLEKNPEFADSLSGWLYWGNAKIFVAGDVEDAAFSLEESLDGKAISAMWEGVVVDGSCGKAITGLRTVDQTNTRFVMRRATGWN